MSGDDHGTTGELDLDCGCDTPGAPHPDPEVHLIDDEGRLVPDPEPDIWPKP